MHFTNNQQFAGNRDNNEENNTMNAMNTTKSTKLRKICFQRSLPAVMLAAALLVLWQFLAVLINIPHIFPSPVMILLRTWELREILFLHHLPSTLITIMAGWILSVLIGIFLAVVMYCNRYIQAMLQPALMVTQTIPVMCISPLFVLWLGYTTSARLLAVVLSTFYSITLNTYGGMKQADSRKIELLRTYGAGNWDILRNVVIPSAFPGFLTSLKMTFPWAVVDAAAAEWLGANSGLGYFSRRMISAMDGPAVFAPIVLLCLIALAGMLLLRLADRNLAYYRSQM
mgnify:CR=1 FL=1